MSVADRTPPAAPTIGLQSLVARIDQLLQSRSGCVLLLVLNGIFWTLYSTVSAGNGLHHDMLEAFAWAQEPAWGYSKHPPFWAWVADLWFKIFPIQDWAFYLLAQVNAQIAIVGAWLLARQIYGRDIAGASVLLLLLTPFYTFISIRYNANIILLSLWPWTAYVFVRALETNRLVWSIAFGLLAAACMLSKYYTLLLLGSCFLASLLHPRARPYYRSASPYVSIAICAVLFVPHIVWLFNNDFLPFTWAALRTHDTFGKTFGSILGFFFGSLAFHVLIVAALLFVMTANARWSAARKLWATLRDRSQWPWHILSFGPLVLTAVAGLAGHIRLSPAFASPIFPLLPALLLSAWSPPLDAVRTLAIRIYLAIVVAAAVSAPFVPYVSMRFGEPFNAEPRAELYATAEKFWNDGSTAPLRIVGGSWPYSLGMSFHASTHPSFFEQLDMRFAPWISTERIAREGMLIVCTDVDSVCKQSVEPWHTPQTRTTTFGLTRTLWGYTGPEARFTLYAIPPTVQGK
ncbi:glycosyltransferase family 39 protein [Roseiarcaceae bacterium H3SJ34-1]|uniref:glycosyltransferase family 39 protein n=1 Tax=Terripilifer ovatus TaxID=3032367 RepID=UPI003AB927DE|nr:glycosyltransferase family 39 protein [Roseiarcaceae bacterium H3SJ34-1]